ncbi:ion transporter [Amphiplicatus metriothermophilus]|uniref:Voltage-gated sodium channel n=1 Tax=Amphiplicatus metriothermophilus TaxID=1519374 RepID=A0A239PPG2_9PROT|nr:ion transporter [Amphiplicatus metriothermophilus]MBB5518904.1 voltage-gated sodium channel [Amphiplicatus metriothermophilus]SNT71943.1 voltage-gated sodium channel [Amphiplicatus metriothermophilus]
MLRDLVRRCVESRWFQYGVLALIVFNAVILGADTIPAVRAALGQTLLAADRIIVYAFVGEIALRIYAYRLDYFKSGWNLFDFLIVFISLFAASSGLSALRAFRVLRVLRVIAVIPRMRVVVSALLDAIPGIASAGVVIVLILYVFAVIAANLYGAAHPALFGDVFAAMYTLFQVMTLEGWPDIAEAVRETHPRSWAFFVSFLLIGAFTLLNLFVAIVVRAVEEDAGPLFGGFVEEQRALREEVAALRREIAALARRER